MSNTTSINSGSWPFESVSRARFDALPERAKGALDCVFLREVAFAEREQLANYRSKEARLQKSKASTLLRVVAGTALKP